MRLCSYCTADNPEPQLGLVVGDEVRRLAVHISTDPLRTLLESGDPASQVAATATDTTVALSDVRFLPPIRRPDKFICIGLNYRSHAEEAQMEIPDVPTFFVKLPNAIAAANEPLIVPRISSRIDWEGELAMVIGRRAKDLDTANALDHVAGYTIHNDITARDLQFKTSQWIVGKTLDGFAPIGPFLTTPDEVGDPQDLHLVTRLNGEVVQDASTNDMIFGIAEILVFLSSLMTLEPGDIIATGTPAGIGASMRPRRWLKDGDRVDITIDNLGTLSTPIRSTT